MPKQRAGGIGGMFSVQPKDEAPQEESPQAVSSSNMKPRSVRLSPDDLERLAAALESLKDQGVKVTQSDLWRSFLLDSLGRFERGEPVSITGENPRGQLSPDDLERLAKALEAAKAKGIDVDRAELWRFFLLDSLERYERGELELPTETTEKKRIKMPE